MAKTTTGRAAPAKVKAAAKAGKAKAADKKAAGKMAPTKAPPGKAAAPRMAPTPKKEAAPGKSPPMKKAAAKSKAPPAKKAAASKKAVPPPKVPASRTAAPPRAAVRAKTVAVKKAAPRRTATRTAVPTPAARRIRTLATARPAPSHKLSVSAPRVFTVSHLSEADFKADGPRAYAKYRDLGIAAATSGSCQAHVIRLIPPCTDDVRKRHAHQTELQLVYVLKGWIKNEFEGYGEQMMSEGSCWLQPSGIRHAVLDYSPDCELLEIIVPADFKTDDLI